MDIDYTILYISKFLRKYTYQCYYLPIYEYYF